MGLLTGHAPYRIGHTEEDCRTSRRVAVLIPCFNEEMTIGPVVSRFRAALPEAIIYVFDNNSEDRTIEFALAAGALVRREPLQGKGHVVRRAFADVEADVYVLVDGDDTYDAAASSTMVHMLEDQKSRYGRRVSRVSEPSNEAAYRRGHQFGNRLFTGLVAAVFGAELLIC